MSPGAQGSLPPLVTAFDWIIIVLTLLAALAGYLQGFFVGAATLRGVRGGLVLGCAARAGALVEGGSRRPTRRCSALLGALLGGWRSAPSWRRLGHGVRAPRAAARRGRRRRARRRRAGRRVALGVAWSSARSRSRRRASASCAARSSARLSCARSTLLPPSGRSSTRWRASTPCRGSTGPPARVPPPTPAIARDPRGRRRGARASCACGAPRAASASRARAGSPATASSSPTPTSSPARTTRRSRARDGPRLEAQAVAFDPRNDVAVLRVAGLGGRALRLASDPRPGAARDPRLPAERAVPRARRPPGRHGHRADQDAYGNGPLRAADRRRCAGACSRATPAARSSTRAGACDDGVRRHDAAARPVATASRTRSCAARSRARGGPSARVPAPAEEPVPDCYGCPTGPGRALR